MKPIAIVLNGASSAGKGAIARAIQELAGKPVLHVSLDMFTDMFQFERVHEQKPYAMEVDTSAHSPTESEAAILRFIEDAEKAQR
jgi:chloramphenicol 3-O-phosphotransferase